jgi:hypothetical protein
MSNYAIFYIFDIFLRPTFWNRRCGSSVPKIWKGIPTPPNSPSNVLPATILKASVEMLALPPSPPLLSPARNFSRSCPLDHSASFGPHKSKAEIRGYIKAKLPYVQTQVTCFYKVQIGNFDNLT